MNIYQSVLQKLNSGEKIVLVACMKNDGGRRFFSEKHYYTEADITAPGFGGQLAKNVYEGINQSLATGEIKIIENQESDVIIVEPFFPQPQLIVLGGGHIAKPLTEFAARLGFLVIVVDDRLSFANSKRFPTAGKVICESFAKCFDLLKLNAYAYIVIVTRGHRHDMDCLRSALKNQWKYLGMIGSRRRVKSITEQLMMEGYSPEVLAKINAPIGLEIGAVTPDEIAISILAQIISFRRLQDPRQGRNSPQVNWTEFDRDVIEELAQARCDKKALVTVIATKGSVPRKAGAKMIVWPDGRILGSIGGGCSEARVTQTALDVILQGGYMVQDIDMTGSIAEDEGMVCGGIMKVLIESIADDNLAKKQGS